MPPSSPSSRRRFLAGSASLLAATTFARVSRAQGTPRPGGTLVVAADTEPRNLNPAMVASNDVFYVASKVIEPLAEASFEGPPRPLLATSWQGTPDGASITFKLRPGVKFHDGQPFGSADVAFSAMEVWKPLQNFGRLVFKNLTAVDTPDEGTAVFRFTQPTPPQLIQNALPALTSVLPKHLYAGTDLAGNPHNAQLVGTGPFRFGEYKPGQYYRLTKSPDYWDRGYPYLDGIVFKVLPDAASISNALETGDIQLAAFSAVPMTDLDRLAATGKLVVVSKGYEAITYQIILEINHRRKEFQDVRVRQAMAHAIDKSFLVKTVFLGYAQAAIGPIPESAKTFFDPNLAAYDFDPAKANQLLDAAGYKRGDDGVRFRVKLLPAPWFNESRQSGDYVRQALKAVGIEAEIVNNDAAGHIKAVYSDHTFDLAIGTPVYRNDPAISTTILFQGGVPSGVPFSNQYGYDDPAMDAIIAKAAVTIDSAARTQLYWQFQELALKQLPLINLVNFSFLSVANKSVQNVADNPRWVTSSWYNTWLAG
jgi:peptide/nickel transport system substrate-binding protein